MPESIPATLIIDTLKDTFREARAALAAEVAEPPKHSHLGWILSVPDTHQKSVLAALDKEEEIRICLALLGVSRIGAVDKSYLHPATPVTPPHVSSAFPLLHEGY